MTPESYSPATARAESLRGHGSVLAEETGEVGGIGEAEVVGNLGDRLVGEYELALGLGEHALADEMPGGDADRALDVIVEPVGRHGEPLGVEGDVALAPEVILDQAPQRLDRCVGRRERHGAGARAACGD